MNDLFDTPHRLLDLDHTQLPYWKVGTGPDLVFVHGWPLDARTWRNIVTPLKAHFTCHLLDLPGAGQSRWSPSTPSGIEGMVEVLCQAIEQMDLKGGFGLIGHDSGGTFARMAAARMPERITGMVLGNTEIPGHHPWRLRLLLAAARNRVLRRTFPAVLGSRVGRWLLGRDCFHDRSLIESQLKPIFLDPLLASPRRLAGAMAMGASIKPRDFDAVAEAHPRITAPVKLVWGAQDPWFPLKHCRGMLEQFGGRTDLVVVPRGKLLVHEELPERFATEIQSHFASAHMEREVYASAS